MIPIPNKEIKEKEICSENFSAKKPMPGGPRKKPIKAMLVITVSACCGVVVWEFPANVYTNGTTAEIPNPTIIKEMSVVKRVGNKTALIIPIKISVPLMINVILGPNFRTTKSEINRPIAIAAI